MKKKKWDANWERLRLETKVDILRKKIKELQGEQEEGIRSAEAAASTALYIANGGSHRGY